MKKVITIVFTIGLFGLFLASCGNSGTQEKKKETKKEVKKEMAVNLENGKTIYNKACIACHWKGVAGAAALSDKTRWEEIAAKGMDTIHKHAMAGFQGEYGVMPEKGTCTDCSSQDIYDAIGFMMNKAGVAAK